jgi:methylmalonyl-CoA/ethylmalonyl-CoA epimerase
MRFHHVGIATPNAATLDSLVRFVGGEAVGSGFVESFCCRCDFYRVREQLIEVVEPLPGDGPIRRWTDANGVGLHHVAFEVPDLMASVRTALRAGISFQSGIERGALPDMYVTFCDRQTTAGLLIELVEFRRQG